jgi:hypothetical protein
LPPCARALVGLGLVSGKSLIRQGLGQLDRGLYGCILDLMDTPVSQAPGTPRAFDGFYRKPNKKTKMATFRIYEEDFVKLKTDYEGNMGLLVRVMLEQFFQGKLPSVEAAFKQQFKVTTTTIVTTIEE